MYNIPEELTIKEYELKYFELFLKSMTNVTLRLREEMGSKNMLKIIFQDIRTEFPDLKPISLVKAFRNGSLGKYGQTYKLTTQILCVWIRKYIESKKPTESDLFYNNISRKNKR